MKPTDLRNLTWRDVLTHVTEDMVRVHLAWQAYGPGTTRQVAQQSGISLLTLRPRTTDLYKLGLVAMSGAVKSEGVYSYVDRVQAEISGQWESRADFRGQKSEARGQPVGFITVEQAIASLAEPERAALGARLMSQFGHHLKRRQPGAGQLELLPA